ncbi:hypothetical protein Kpho01_26980 [Kitasatospora phosalacinea]|uniref:Uncharacterized protein n=1 Tax=Kitasatospora phosalacinea TaxID=2065 RepID=A0A9W6UP07_9ACTN|nr:hypothetical protein Kpho01_26980 [Kitasatospora phosalacinea]
MRAWAVVVPTRTISRHGKVFRRRFQGRPVPVRRNNSRGKRTYRRSHNSTRPPCPAAMVPARIPAGSVFADLQARVD